jgi:large conductance mechanosensitive channel
MASILKEFEKFAMRGNVVDLAVGVIIGGAFGAIVNSLVNDIIMPPIGKLTGGQDLSNHFIALDGNHYATFAEAKAHTAVIGYGNFTNTVVNFLIIAFAIFLLVKLINKLYPPPVPPPAGPSEEVKVLTDIRDLLAKPRI